MLECRNLVKKYLTTTAVDGVSLNIVPGQIYALLGPNGSGKSTLMKMIAGISKPSSGEIYLDGEPLNYKHKARIAYMSTEAYFFPYMNSLDIIKYYSDFFEDFNKEKALNIIRQMGLNEKQKVKTMSTGMMAKLKIAINLSRASEIIMLDEPLNGIDVIAREQILVTIMQNMNPNTSVIMSSHLVEELEKIVTYAIYIRNGQCVLQGDANMLREQSGKSIVDLYKQIYAYGNMMP